MQGVSFTVDVFIVDSINYDMVLGIQWLVTLDNIVSKTILYLTIKDLWMSLEWQGQDVLLKGIDYSKIQTIELTQLNNLLVNHT